jgi:hypothetical protein
MQKLSEAHGQGVTRRAMLFLEHRLASRPQTAGMAGEVRAGRESLQRRTEAWEGAREARLGASAEVAFLDGELDGRMSRLSRAALVLVDGNREDARYRRLFPVGLTEAVRPVGGEEQAGAVERALSALSDAATYGGLSEHGAALSEGLAALRGAEQRRRGLMQAEGEARTELVLAKEDAQRLYNRMYHRLFEVLGEERLVESFFRAVRSSSEPGAEEDEG